MNYSIYADLSRPLTEYERIILAEVLIAIVPDGGCVGIQKGPNDEVYFILHAESEEAAKTQAMQYMNRILLNAKIDIAYEITLQSLN